MLLNAVLAILAGLHQAFAGFSCVGPLILATLRFCPAVAGSPCDGRLLAAGKAVLAALLLVPVVGIAAGLVLYGSNDIYGAMLNRFPARAYWLAGGELLFTLAVYAAWLGTWRRWQHKLARGALLAGVGATNLLYHFPPLMIVQKMLTARPELAQAGTIERHVFLDLMRTPEVLARTLHFAGQGTLVSCAILLLLIPPHSSEEHPQRLRRYIASFAITAIAIQTFTGMAMLLVMPVADSAKLVGTHLPTAACLAGVLLLTLLLLRRWCRVAIYPNELVAPTGLAWPTLAVVLVMTLASRL